MEYFIAIAFLLYFLMLMSIGFFFYAQTTTASAFIVGNRSINYWVTAIATQASDMGGWIFFALPATIYTSGMLQAWTAIGLWVFMFINWIFIAPRLREKTAHYNASTLATFFQRRFNEDVTQVSLHQLTTFISLVFFIFYISSSFVALGRLFESIFHISYTSGVYLGLLFAVGYTLLGGFIAIAWTDFFQGMFLFFVIVFVPCYAFWMHPNPIQTIYDLQKPSSFFSLFPSAYETIQGIILACSWGLGYFGQPHIIANFMGIKSKRDIRAAMYIGMLWQGIVFAAAIGIGIVGLAYFHLAPADSESLFIKLVTQLFHPFLSGCMLCAILAAILSTVDSHILISGSLLAECMTDTEDPEKKNAHTVWLSRVCSLGVSLISLTMALYSSSSIYLLVNYAWSGFGSALGPVVLIALYGPTWITHQGACAGILTGTIVSLLFPYITPDLLPLIPGFSSGMIAIYLVSYLTYPSKPSLSSPTNDTL
ncbi:MAG: sodium/proline symporter [Candidatus Babeliales bacterium]